MSFLDWDTFINNSVSRFDKVTEFFLPINPCSIFLTISRLRWRVEVLVLAKDLCTKITDKTLTNKTLMLTSGFLLSTEDSKMQRNLGTAVLWYILPKLNSHSYIGLIYQWRQNIPPQSHVAWHVDPFELNALGKTENARTLSFFFFFFFFSKNREMNCPCGKPPLPM